MPLKTHTPLHQIKTKALPANKTLTINPFSKKIAKTAATYLQLSFAIKIWLKLMKKPK